MTARAHAILLVAAVLALAYGLGVRHGLALSDEYVYVVGARYFADTGSLNARFYSANAILAQGYPHQDMHPPGYALLLGALERLLPFGYWTAVVLNLVAYACGSLAVRSLGRSLGVGEGAANAAGVLFLLLPGLLPYVYWALPEALVAALLVGVAALTARARSVAAAAVAGVAFGAALLVRESILFGLPAVWALAAERKRWRAFTAGAAVLLLCAYVPLSRHRAEGGTNFWRPTTTDSAFAFDALAGGPLRLLGGMQRQLSANVSVFRRDFSGTEKAILAVYAAAPLLALLRWRSRTAAQRRFLAAAAGGFLALAAATAVLFSVPPWSGLRYWMLFPPLFLPLLTDGVAARAGRWGLGLALAVGGLLDVACLQTFNAYKASRQARQQDLTDYVERYLGPGRLSRVVLENGWLFGLRHYPVEVLSTPPADFDALRFLQKDLWFDFVAARPHSGLAGGLEMSRRYELVNGEDPERPIVIYRRLR